jgi:spermidine synthase
VGLLGSTAALRWNTEQVQRRLAEAPRAASFGFEDPLALLGSFVAGSASLRQWAGDAALNTDDHPVVAYRAPRVTYAPDNPPADRLVALLGQLDPDTGTLLDRGSDAGWSSRLAAYVAARRDFIAAGRGIPALSDPEAMLVRVRGPLMDVLRRSPDFRPAYDPLWRLAAAVAPRDPRSARALLAELVRVQPARHEAADQLRALPIAP